ncbi:MAG: hypothetical protein ACE5EY_03185, partial [Anaerolineae bacterium]
ILTVDGRDVEAVWYTANDLINRIRGSAGPQLLHASCVHLDGHFLGYQMTRIVNEPIRELPPVAWPLTRSLLRRGGAPFSQRWAGLKTVLDALWATFRDPRRRQENDPLQMTRRKLAGSDGRLQEIETGVETWLDQILDTVLTEVSV